MSSDRICGCEVETSAVFLLLVVMRSCWTVSRQCWLTEITLTLLAYHGPSGAGSSSLVCLHVPWYTRGLIGCVKFSVCAAFYLGCWYRVWWECVCLSRPVTWRRWAQKIIWENVCVRQAIPRAHRIYGDCLEGISDLTVPYLCWGHSLNQELDSSQVKAGAADISSPPSFGGCDVLRSERIDRTLQAGTSDVLWLKREYSQLKALDHYH